jgi:hypothetical protein
MAGKYAPARELLLKQALAEEQRAVLVVGAGGVETGSANHKHLNHSAELRWRLHTFGKTIA